MGAKVFLVAERGLENFTGNIEVTKLLPRK